ncbi:recombinase family protein [Trebonia sp.]|uniref:recombinase family protein n=1 Tax=Trebonia sp. TaxID=2767075 RepID=UPI0026213B0E|nr:recombinase family protein [Trebonia sp.]
MTGPRAKEVDARQAQVIREVLQWSRQHRQHPRVTAVAAEPVPVAIFARTSTLALQDPVASVRRQIRACQQWLPPGWFIAAVYSDVESGGTDLEARSRTQSWRVLTDAGLPRDGGMADLLAEAADPAPRFAAVVCEDIERSARDTFNALKLERELSRQGIPLFATDEPADIAGINPTTVLVRRVKQGVAEWYRLQLRDKVWKGLVEHSLDGWNTGTPPYGYAAQRCPHPNPAKAAQGRTKTRLVPDPATAPAVAAIFTWRTVDKLGLPAIAARLAAAPGLYPPPGGAATWAASGVDAIVRNPKYTGHMVFGRRRTRGGRRVPVPPSEWLWTPQPVHPALVDRDTWQAAQGIGAEHATSRDPGRAGPPPAARFYPYRSRIRCRDCRRRMTGTAKGAARHNVYYRCPHDPGNPRHAAASPGHPASVAAPEHRLDAIVAAFFRDRIFTPARTAYLAGQLPATDADAAAQAATAAAALQARIRKLDTAQNAQITALEQIPAGPASPAAAALRARIMDRFAQLHGQRTQAETELTALTRTAPRPADPALLEEIPYAGDILPALPPALKARLFAAFDLTVLWNKPDGQATVHVQITDHTLNALPAILNPGQDGYHDTHPQPKPTAPPPWGH